jgi:HSP20 family protein
MYRMRRHMADLINDFDRTSSSFFNDPTWRESEFLHPRLATTLTAPSFPLIDDFFDSSMYNMNQLAAPQKEAVVNAQGRTEEEQKGDSTALTTTPLAGSLWQQQLPSISVNVVEKEKDYLISADLPGVDKNDVKLSVHDGVLTIRAERRQLSDISHDTTPLKQDIKQREQREGKFRRIERQYGLVTRSFKLPGNVDVSKLSAKHENGVLNINLPKTEAATAKPIEVKIQ